MKHLMVYLEKTDKSEAHEVTRWKIIGTQEFVDLTQSLSIGALVYDMMAKLKADERIVIETIEK